MLFPLPVSIPRSQALPDPPLCSLRVVCVFMFARISCFRSSRALAFSYRSPFGLLRGHFELPLPVLLDLLEDLVGEIQLLVQVAGIRIVRVR